MSLVIADDLSGAAEMAGIAWQSGLNVKIISGNGRYDREEEDVLVINTESRNMPEIEAANTVMNVLKSFGDLDGADLFKKTDSLLRGPVKAEILTLLACSPYTSALLVPANPSKGRRISAGKYFIGTMPLEKTEYRHDPEYPRTSSDIRVLINAGSDEVETGEFDWDHIEGKILVPDQNSLKDISALLEQNIAPGILPAGGADFFREWLFSLHQPEKNIKTESLAYPGNGCFIFGSYAAANRKALGLLKQNHYEIFTLGDKTIPGIDDGRVVLKMQDQFEEDAERRDFLLDKLTGIASELAETKERALHFLVTGGRTASLFCRKMAWSQFMVRGRYDEGVVTLQPGESEHLITIKPGSYDWPEELLK